MRRDYTRGGKKVYVLFFFLFFFSLFKYVMYKNLTRLARYSIFPN